MRTAAQISGDNAANAATYDLALLEQSLAKWVRCRAVRTVYRNIYESMADHAIPGPALEIGSGCGTAREFITDLVTSDIRKTPYVDCQASAYAVDRATGGPWSTIYALDVLHHLREPLKFFASAARALAPGGRIVLCDPAATPLACFFYRTFHQEPIEPARIQPPFAFPADSAAGDFANMAMAQVLFGGAEPSAAPALVRLGLRISSVSYRDVFAYPATGGLSRRALLPAPVLKVLLQFEARLPQVFLRLVGLRMMIVVEKPPISPAHATDGADKS